MASFSDYLKAFPGGTHAQEAKLRYLDAVLADPTPSKAFDGTWLTTWTCPAAGSALGYSYQFPAQVKDGKFHAQQGAAGERGSLILDGKIEPDGTAAFFGNGVVGASAYAVGNVAAGRPFSFHASGHFERGNGTGQRIEDRNCYITFAKQ
jgi:hypothetical protein